MSYRLLDHARACETNQRFRLGKDQIAKHCKARGDASGSRISEHRNVWQVTLFQRGQRRGDLRHLHQRQRAFLHTRAARSGKHDYRAAVADRSLNQSRNLFSDRRTHRAADKIHVHRARIHSMAAHLSARRDHCFRQTSRMLSLGDALCVRFAVNKTERIG